MHRGRFVYHGCRWLLSAWTGIESSVVQSPPSLPTVFFANPTTCLMNFSKCGISPNSSVSRLVICLTKIAMLIWQLDFDLQYNAEAHVLWLSSQQCPFICPCSVAAMCLLLNRFVSFQAPGAVKHACASLDLCSQFSLSFYSSEQTSNQKLGLKQSVN